VAPSEVNITTLSKYAWNRAKYNNEVLKVSWGKKAPGNERSQAAVAVIQKLVQQSKAKALLDWEWKPQVSPDTKSFAKK
jgi:hypothetical protein